MVEDNCINGYLSYWLSGSPEVDNISLCVGFLEANSGEGLLSACGPPRSIWLATMCARAGAEPD